MPSVSLKAVSLQNSRSVSFMSFASLFIWSSCLALSKLLLLKNMAAARLCGNTAFACTCGTCFTRFNCWKWNSSVVALQIETSWRVGDAFPTFISCSCITDDLYWQWWHLISLCGTRQKLQKCSSFPGIGKRDSLWPEQRNNGMRAQRKAIWTIHWAVLHCPPTFLQCPTSWVLWELRSSTACRQHQVCIKYYLVHIVAKCPTASSSEDTSSSISDAFSSSCFGHIYRGSPWFMCHVFLILQDVEDASFQPTLFGRFDPLDFACSSWRYDWDSGEPCFEASTSNLKGQGCVYQVYWCENDAETCRIDPSRQIIRMNGRK